MTVTLQVLLQHPAHKTILSISLLCLMSAALGLHGEVLVQGMLQGSPLGEAASSSLCPTEPMLAKADLLLAKAEGWLVATLG